VTIDCLYMTSKETGRFLFLNDSSDYSLYFMKIGTLVTGVFVYSLTKNFSNSKVLISDHRLRRYHEEDAYWKFSTNCN
jgi:hypothetical protein